MKAKATEVFELLVGQNTDPTAPSYPLTITQAPSGEASGVCLLDPNDDDLQDALVALEEGDFDAEFLQDIGTLLFDEFFPADIQSILRTSMSLVRTQEQDGDASMLRIRLRIEPSELATLPWELLFDAEEDTFLAISPELPLVRYAPARLPARAMKVKPPLRLLIVLANPDGLEPLDIEHEQSLILQALADLIAERRLQVEFVEQGTVANISQAIRSFRPHIFHFIGHGLFDGSDAYIVLEDDAGQAEPVNERTFREFFTGSSDTRLVLLNACQTATASSSKPLAGLAPLLLQRKLSAVIAMQYPISDEAAQIFSREFYRSLAAGFPVDAAVAEARKGIYMVHNTRGSGHSSDTTALDWATPVVFMRAKDGHLFDIDEPEPAETASAIVIPAPPEPKLPIRINPFIGRTTELQQYREELDKNGWTVITGMSGVGKTAIATELLHRHYHQDRVFWHSFRPSDDIDNVLWKLAGFLAWHQQPALWEMIQRAYLTGGTLAPPPLLLDYALELLRQNDPTSGRYLICLDNVYLNSGDVNEDRHSNFDMMVDKIRIALASRGDSGDTLPRNSFHLLITSQHTPDFVSSRQMYYLDGLSVSEASTLLEAYQIRLDTLLMQTLHARTQGNAQFLHLSIAALKRTQQPEQVIQQLVDTDDIERYLITEVDQGLNDMEKETMTGVSVLLGYPGTRDVIEAVTERSWLRRVLTELNQRNLLMVSENLQEAAKNHNQFERRYIQNPLIRDFYYTQLGRSERQKMHFLGGVYYREEEFEPLQAVLHLYRAGEVVEAAELAVEHARVVAQQGFSTPLLEMLNAITVEDVSPELWTKIHLAKGYLYRHTSQTDLAKLNYEAAMQQLASLPDSPPIYQLRTDVCLRIGHLLVRHSQPEARRWLRRGVKVIEEQKEGKPLARILKKLEQSGNERQQGNRRRQVNFESLMTKLSQQAQPHSAVFPETEAELNMILGLTHVLDGDAAQGLTLVQTGLNQLPHALRNDSVRLHGLTILGQAYMGINQPNKARTTYLDALALAEKIGYLTQMSVLLNNLMVIAFNAGEWPKALTYLQQSIDLAEQTGNIPSQTRLQLNAGFIATDLGNDVDALTFLQRSIELADAHEIPRYQSVARSYLARLYIRQKQPRQALPLLDEAYHISQAKSFRNTFADLYRRFAQVALLLDDFDDACEWVQKSLDMAVKLSQKSEEGKAQRVLGQVSAALGDYEAAGNAFPQSLTLLAAEPYEHARTQMALAQYLQNVPESRLHGKFDVDALRKEAEKTVEGLTG